MRSLAGSLADGVLADAILFPPHPHIIKLNSGIGPVACPYIFYPASVVLFQLHGGIVSHMQVLPTSSSTVHNTKYLDPYH